MFRLKSQQHYCAESMPKRAKYSGIICSYQTQRTSRSLRLPFLLCLLYLFLIALHADASTLRRVPQKYKTIQSAIDAARTGDTILVDEGLYYENLHLYKNIILASRFIVDFNNAHIARTMIDGSRAQDKRIASTIFINGPTDTTCVVLGLTIRGGTGSHIHIPYAQVGFQDWISGGGILVVDAGARITHNIVTKNSVGTVGSIDCTGGAGIECIYVRNTLAHLPYVIVEQNIVTENIATGRWVESCGIDIAQHGIARQNVITYNRSVARARAPSGGLGLFLKQGYDVVADGNFICHNVCGIGAGVLVGSNPPHQGNAILVNNIIADNEAFEVGGGIHVAENSTAILINNTIVGNRAGVNGSGLNVASGGSATIINNIFWNNEPHALSSHTNIRAINNLIGGGFPGNQMLNADPLFLPGDSIYRLSSSSPAIGVGTSNVIIAGKTIDAPLTDFTRVSRPSPGMSNPDLGAMESSLGSNERTADILDDWADETGARLKLTLFLKQTTSPQFSRDSLQIVHAGLMTARAVANDSNEYVITAEGPVPEFTLPPGKNVLEVELIARGRSESRHLYSILRIEGLDPVYSSMTSTREHIYRRYADIPPGLYTLVFYAGDEVGLIDAINKRSIRIIVQPFWYQRWWAYVLLTAIVSGFVLFFSRMRIRQLRKEKKLQQQFTKQQLETQEAERKRLASELHDGLGQDLLVVNNELHQFMKDQAYSREDIHHVSQLVQESIEAVREISSNLHPHHIERLGFCAAVEAMVEKLSHSTSIKIHCTCSGVDNVIAKEARIHVFRIIQESLTNIVKHSSATEACLTISKKEDFIEVTIDDNGKGFDTARFSLPASSHDRHDRVCGFGITSMNERARIVGGILSIESAQNHGTKISLGLPVSKG